MVYRLRMMNGNKIALAYVIAFSAILLAFGLLIMVVVGTQGSIRTDEAVLLAYLALLGGGVLKNRSDIDKNVGKLHERVDCIEQRIADQDKANVTAHEEMKGQLSEVKAISARVETSVEKLCERMERHLNGVK